MTRRTLLKLIGSLAVLGTPLFSRLAKGITVPHLLIYDSAQGHYSGFLKATGVGSESVIIWDIRKDQEKIRTFLAKYGRNTKIFSWPVLLANPETNAEEVEYWDSAWLRAKARASFEDTCYPISGSWWSVDGDWYPTKEKVDDHLFLSPIHAGGKFQKPYLDLLTLEEVQSLHSDHHREMTQQGEVIWTSVNVECPMP